MKSTQVNSHKRKGRVVKSHSRAVKGAMKNSGSGMSAEECKAKYDAMVAKYGENSPQAKKLAMKMEGMETVEKDARKKYSGTPDQQKIKSLKATGLKRKSKNPIANGFTKKQALEALKEPGKKVKKHSRGDYMRKNVEEELLTKEAKAKFGKKVKKLSSKEVDAVYSKTPALDNPSYKKKISRGSKMGTSVISVAADNKRYRVASNGKGPDTWHEVKKYGTKKSRKK